MFLLGILGLLQVWFLPGIFLLSFSKKIKVIDTIILSLPLSILVNYLIVLVLVLTNNYKHEIVLLIIIFELFFIIFNYRKNIDFNNTIQSIEKFLKFKNLMSINLNLLDFLILLPFSLILLFGLNTIGDPLDIGDSLIQYNAWGIEWYNNKVPNEVGGKTGAYGEYPPAIAMTMSLVYKIINNTSVEIFTKAIFIIYPSWILLVFYRAIHLLPNYKNIIQLTCFITLSIFLFIFRHTSMYTGLIEPVLFLTSGCTALIMILIYKQKEDLKILDYLLFGLIVASGPLTKQTGLYLAFLFPLTYLLLFHKILEVKKLIINFFYISAPLLIPITWYLFIIISRSHMDFNDSYLINKIISFDQSSFLEKIYGMFGIFAAPCIIILIFSLFNRLSFFIFILVLVPYFILYFNFFGYDNRHLTPIIPFLSFNVAVGIFEIIKKLKIDRIRFPNYTFLICTTIILILSLVYVSFYRNDSRLIADSTIKKMKRGNIQINTLLYAFIDDDNLKILVIPGHLGFQHLPKLGKRVVSNVDCSKDTLSKFLKRYKNHYLMINTRYCSEYSKSFNLTLFEDDYKELFKFEEYYLFKKD